MDLLNLIDSIKKLDKKLSEDYEVFENDSIESIYEKVYENNIDQIQILRGCIVFFFLRNDMKEKQTLWNITIEYKNF